MGAQGSRASQQSVYSMTLNQIQHNLSGTGRDLGSMNFEEFLRRVYSAVEDQTMINTFQPPPTTFNENYDINGNNYIGNTDVQMGMHAFSQGAAYLHNGIASQPSLGNQPLLYVPETLSGMTFEDILADTLTGQLQNEGPRANAIPNLDQAAAAADPITYEEITLEEFLIMVGICRRDYLSPPPDQIVLPVLQPQRQQFGVYQNNNINLEPEFGGTSMMGNPGEIGAGASAVQGMPQGGGAIMKSSVYGGYGHMDAAMFPQQPQAVAPDGMNELGQAIGISAPISPMTPDVIYEAALVHISADQFRMDRQSRRRRRTITNGTGAMIQSQRRHRKMIKNRESAARSRARRQAYTEQLEAQVEQMRAENSHLRQTLVQRRLNGTKKGNASVSGERAKE